MCVPRSDRRSRASSGLGLFALYSLLFVFFSFNKTMFLGRAATVLHDKGEQCLEEFVIPLISQSRER
jgi:hypothetical protein